MFRSLMRNAIIFAAAVASLSCSPILSCSGSAAELRPIAPIWQEIAIDQEHDATGVRSRAGSETIALRLAGQVKVLQNDRPLLAVDNRKILLDRFALADAIRGKPADEVLAAYRDYVNADLKRRGWRELTEERTNIAAGASAPGIYWASQDHVTSAGKPLTVAMCMAAALVGSNIVAVTGIAEDAEGAAVLKRYLADTLATLEEKTAAELSGDDIARLRRTAQIGDWRATGAPVILRNDKLASEKDREAGNRDVPHLSLSPSDLIETVALGVTGSRSGLLTAFVNDGRSQDTVAINAYDPSTNTFTYSGRTGSNMLEAGNNIAGVEAMGESRAWRVKKDQLQKVPSSIIVGKAAVAKASGRIHLGPFGDMGNTLDDARKTDFFKWFGLAETGRSATPDGGTTISFGPGSEEYRPLVTVRIDLAPAGWIRGADIVLKRRFIESDKTSEEANARDIAKSFIASCIKPDDEKDTRVPARGDLLSRLGPGSRQQRAGYLYSADPDRRLSRLHGRREYFMRYLAQSRLWMENIVADGEPALVISIGPAS